MAIDANGVLETWAEITSERTGKLMDIALGLVLAKLGERQIEFTAADMREFVRDFSVERTLDGPVWKVRIAARQQPNQPSLPLAE